MFRSRPRDCARRCRGHWRGRLLIGAVAAALGVGLAGEFGTGHAALYAVLMASSSAAWRCR